MTGSELNTLIFQTVRAAGFPAALSNLIVSMARHETGDYTSNVFKTCNNLFGYKYVGQSTAAGACSVSPEGDRYAMYNSYADSVRELVLWIKRRQSEGVFPADLTTITRADQFAELLKKAGYYGDTVANYASGLKRFLVNYGGGFGMAGLLIAGLVFFFLYKK